MKKKCMIYGNCQHTHLEHFLEKSEFIKYFELVKIKDVYVRDKTFLDDATLTSLDCFIYQHVSAEFDNFFCTDTICSKLRPDCIRIAIPNFWLSAYFPQHIYHPVVRPNRKYSISPSGIFPYGDKNINTLLTAGVRENDIVKLLSDPDYYDKNAVRANTEKSFSALEAREKDFCIDIPSVPWLRSHLTQTYLSVTVNHPTHDYFAWLADSILQLLNIRGVSCMEAAIFPFSHNHIHIPIYPSVIKHLELKFIQQAHCYSFYNEKYSFEQYVRKYIAHATGGNIPGKDSVGVDRVSKVFSNEIKLLPCPQSSKKINELKMFFVGYEQFNPDTNTVIYGDSTLTSPANSPCRDIPGLEIQFDGVGNLVWIHKKATFSHSCIKLNGSGYVRIGKSSFRNLLITNTIHNGGAVTIGDDCIAGEELNIHIYGHNFCTIGNDCIFDGRAKIMCSDGHTLFDENENILNPNAPVHIGNHVWIGYAVTLLKGTIVPDGCAIGAWSIVNKIFREKNSLLAGAPARCFRSNIKWDIKNPDYF